MKQMKYLTFVLFLALCIFAEKLEAEYSCEEYLEWAEREYALLLVETPKREQEWLESHNHEDRLYYWEPRHPIWMCAIASMLYKVKGEEHYAKEAIRWLLKADSYRKMYPDSLARRFPEYKNGVPIVADFFNLQVITRSYYLVRESPSLTLSDKLLLDSLVAATADHFTIYPEWGPMNRALVRATGLLFAAKAMPQHPNSTKWMKIAQSLYEDSIQQWQIEDAQLYQGIWLYQFIMIKESLNEYRSVIDLMLEFYSELFSLLISPTGMIPSNGDSRWEESRSTFLPVFEWAANKTRRKKYKWIALQILSRSLKSFDYKIGGYNAMMLLDAYRWCSNDVQPKKPKGQSSEVLEDLIGKKIVFRNGYDSSSTYLLLNYRDEGDYGFVAREFLRNTIPIEEEKTHHGHADENAILRLMKGGSLLLSASGYRSDIPSGPYGAYRADYFQNRLIVRNQKKWRRQNMFEFIRHSGGYRKVRTYKIDFLSLSDVDVSRTRLIDNVTGYQWDRIIAWLRQDDLFVCVDVVKVLRDDFYTFANLWHAQTVHARGEHYYVTSIDSIGNQKVGNSSHRLLVYFPDTNGKSDSSFALDRRGNSYDAIYQSRASHYFEGSFESFVTILAPHKSTDDVQAIVNSVEILSADASQKGCGIKFHTPTGIKYLCFKKDLRMDLVPENVRPRYRYDRGKIKYGPLETDASVLYANVTKDSIHYSAANMVRIYYQNEKLFQSDTVTFLNQPDDGSTAYGPIKWRKWEDSVALVK